MNLWLLLENVERAAQHLPAFEGRDEGGLVNDGAPGGVDNDYAIFHLLKFCVRHLISSKRVGDVSSMRTFRTQEVASPLLQWAVEGDHVRLSNQLIKRDICRSIFL